MLNNNMEMFQKKSGIFHYSIKSQIKVALDKAWKEQIEIDPTAFYEQEQEEIKEKTREANQLFFKSLSVNKEALTSPVVKIIVAREHAGENQNKFFSQLTIMKNDIKLKCSNLFTNLRNKNYKIPVKSKIKKFSIKSKRTLSENCNNISHNFRNMITLTYPESHKTNGRMIKRDLRTFLERLRTKKIKYFWVLEFQENGTPHFHILVDKFYPKKTLLKDWNKTACITSKASTRVEAIRSKDKGIAYMASYVSKVYQKDVPEGFMDVGRFWGMSRGVVKKETISIQATYQELEDQLKPMFKSFEEICNSRIEKKYTEELKGLEEDIIKETIELNKVRFEFKNKSFKFRNFSETFKKMNFNNWKKCKVEELMSNQVLIMFFNVLNDPRNKQRIKKKLDEIKMYG